MTSADLVISPRAPVRFWCSRHSRFPQPVKQRARQLHLPPRARLSQPSMSQSGRRKSSKSTWSSTRRNRVLWGHESTMYVTWRRLSLPRISRRRSAPIEQSESSDKSTLLPSSMNSGAGTSTSLTTFYTGRAYLYLFKAAPSFFYKASAPFNYDGYSLSFVSVAPIVKYEGFLTFGFLAVREGGT